MTAGGAPEGGRGAGGRSLADAARRLAAAAARRGLRLATAESCTGGLLATTITDLPGASAHYAGGVVAYSNDVKTGHLGVDPASLEEHGAVSRAVALQMACGAVRRFRADLAMAVTGIAGPGGGTPEKPVGTVWLAVAVAGGPASATLKRFPGDRDSVRRASVARVLELAAETAVYGPGGGDGSACETNETEPAGSPVSEGRAAGSPTDQ